MASGIAAILSGRGISSGMFVAVISHSCIEMIAGILGILKAGAAFIPVDSSIPYSRIDFILETSSCEIALTSSSFDRSSLKYGGVEYLDLAQSLSTSDHRYLDSPMIVNSPTDPSYAIFTRYLLCAYSLSGSTGTPKGVVISHLSLSNFIYPNPNLMQAKPNDRIAQVASPSFDMVPTFSHNF
jgi:non-ribosomal peptide synthetase component F